jgi:hypothetical protein
MMITYDSSFYKEIENYFEFEEKNEQFYKDLEDLLEKDGRKSKRILRSPSRKV